VSSNNRAVGLLIHCTFYVSIYEAKVKSTHNMTEAFRCLSIMQGDRLCPWTSCMSFSNSCEVHFFYVH